MNSMQYFIIEHVQCSSIHSTVLIKDNQLQHRAVVFEGFPVIGVPLGFVPATARGDWVCCVPTRTAPRPAAASVLALLGILIVHERDRPAARRAWRPAAVPRLDARGLRLGGLRVDAQVLEVLRQHVRDRRVSGGLLVLVRPLFFLLIFVQAFA